MNSTSTLQLILPTDKRNPSFALYEDDTAQRIHVYYGLELLQVVPTDRDHAQFKLLVANLYNAGLKVTVLEQTFAVDRKTMRRWGQALLAGNAEQLARVLEGRQRRRKLTPEVEPEAGLPLAEEGRKEGGGGVRTVEKACELGRERTGPPPAEPKLLPPIPVGSLLETPPPSAPAGTDDGAQTRSPEPPAVEAPGESMGVLPGGPPDAPGSAEPTAPIQPWTQGQARWCDHLGLLLFWQVLSQIALVLRPPVPWLKQWLASVLLGAHNVEQTKYLNWAELNLLLGPVVAAPMLQRQALSQLATPATVQAVGRWNARLVEALSESDFYLDPHTKHYTGQRPILKGWCPVIRWADKALHSD